MVRGRLQIFKGKVLDWYAAQDRRVVNGRVVRGEGGFPGGGGSFGGGGAGASTPAWGWWPERKRRPKEAPYFVTATFGDAACSESGFKRIWDYAPKQGGGWFGPHPSGHNKLFVGYHLATNWNPDFRNFYPLATWSPENNLPNPFFPGYDVQSYPPGSAPTFGETGFSALPTPGTTDLNTAWWEKVVDEASARPNGSDPSWTDYDCEQRTIWYQRLVACTPPTLATVLHNPAPFDRWRQTSYPYDPRDAGDPKKDPREDDDNSWLPPPFVFTVPLGPPITAPPVVSPLPQPPPRTPPRGRTKERKPQRLRKLLKMLDIVSESMEVLDCFYDALPKPVRKKWEKDRKDRGLKNRGRGLVDQAGQYGIDGADWKAQALYHNWDKVNFPQAVHCSYVNQGEDKIVGTANRLLPVGASTALSREFFRQEYIKERAKQAKKWAAIRAENAKRVRDGKVERIASKRLQAARRRVTRAKAQVARRRKRYGKA